MANKTLPLITSPALLAQHMAAPLELAGHGWSAHGWPTYMFEQLHAVDHAEQPKGKYIWEHEHK